MADALSAGQGAACHGSTAGGAEEFSVEEMRAAAGMAGKAGELSAALKLLTDGFPEAVGDDGGVVGGEINRVGISGNLITCRGHFAGFLYRPLDQGACKGTACGSRCFFCTVFSNRGFEQAAVSDIGLILQDVEDVAVREGRSVPGQDTLGGEETADLLDGMVRCVELVDYADGEGFPVGDELSMDAVVAPDMDVDRAVEMGAKAFSVGPLQPRGGRPARYVLSRRRRSRSVPSPRAGSFPGAFCGSTGCWRKLRRSPPGRSRPGCPA